MLNDTLGTCEVNVLSLHNFMIIKDLFYTILFDLFWCYWKQLIFSKKPPFSYWTPFWKLTWWLMAPNILSNGHLQLHLQKALVRGLVLSKQLAWNFYFAHTCTDKASHFACAWYFSVLFGGLLIFQITLVHVKCNKIISLNSLFWCVLFCKVLL